MPKISKHYPIGIRSEVTEVGGSVISVRSKLEQRVLDDLSNRGVTWAYEPHTYEYELVHKYTPDVLLLGPSGAAIYVEIKGYFVAQDRTKLRAVKQQHPELDLRLLFQDGSKTLSSRSKTTYRAWADKYGFPSCEGRIPDAWVHELMGPLQ